jgi:alkylation response protein AidB-like acyl-CoA dehydrogenase
MIVQAVIAQARGAITDSFLWAKQRKIFGKTLIDQPVIRNKLAGAVAALESVQAVSQRWWPVKFTGAQYCSVLYCTISPVIT